MGFIGFFVKLIFIVSLSSCLMKLSDCTQPKSNIEFLGLCSPSTRLLLEEVLHREI